MNQRAPLSAARFAWLGVGLALAVAPACGGEPPDGVESLGQGTAPVRTPSSSLAGDLAPVSAAPEASGAASGETTIRSALGAGGSDPKVFYLVYADGTEQINANYNACSGVAPRFNCTFAPTLAECQSQVQAYLDRWYADFNIIFTLTRPTSGSYYTEVVSSGGGAWCGVADNVAGIAPFLCKDLHGGVSYALDGGASAHATAVIVAQEQAHLLGLEHTTSSHDIMLPTICSDCDGFENDVVATTGDRCDRPTQNSYQMMMAALGPWGGGPKPSAFGCMSDSAPPTVSFVAPGNGANMGHDFSVQVNVRDDCAVSKVEVSVMPEGLTASATAPPYEWDLTGINGAQTITVVATDGSGRTGAATIAITAPASRDDQGAMDAGAGCTVASGAYGAAGLFPALAMLLIFTGHHRRSRRRTVAGALNRSSRRPG